MKIFKNQAIEKNDKITWVNLLHFYQPPMADRETVIEAAEKSYKKIIQTLKKNPQIKFTLNLTGCLLEKLDQLGYHDLIADIKSLYEAKRIELTGTAAFHPILPLIPEQEIIRNIEINEAILKKYFGKKFHPSGFFMPELAYSAKAAKIIADFNYQWIILDEISAYGKLNKLDFNKSYLAKDSGLKIFFRNRAFSRSYVPKTILDLLSQKYRGLALTGTDAELYGLRHHDLALDLEKLIKSTIPLSWQIALSLPKTSQAISTSAKARCC